MPAGSDREKYLATLEKTEKLEQSIKLQKDLLRRIVNDYAQSVAGLNEGLDANLADLVQKIRGAGGAAVVDQVKRVDLYARDIGNYRASRHQSWLAQLRDLCEGFKALKLDASAQTEANALRTALRQAGKHGSSSWFDYLPLIIQLTKLQSTALNSAAEPDSGLWQRLKGGRRISEEVGEDDALALKPEGQSAEAETSSAAISLQQDISDTDQIALQRAQEILRDVAKSITPMESIEKSLESFRQQLESPMTWGAVPKVLDTLRDILMASFLAADSEFNTYLTQVNTELHEIGAQLSKVLASDAQNVQSANAFENSVSQHMSQMRSHLASATTVESLRDNVQSQLNRIQAALEKFQAEQNSEHSLAGQLKSLIAKVERIEAESQKTKDLLEEERYKATHDALTKVPNRVAYNERVAHEWQRFQRYAHPLSLAVCDIDHFKSFNDRFGHQTGDKVLAVVAKLLRERVREVDFVARYGGEEFVILFPETSGEDAQIVIEKVRSAIAAASMRANDETVSVTASFGLTQFQKADTVVTAFERADAALYKAKGAGRNCCIRE